MDNKTKNMVEYINFLISKNIELIKEDLALKLPADIERVTSMVNEGQDVVSNTLTVDNNLLNDFDLSIENAETQGEMINCFRYFISKVSKCYGFFVLKDDKGICFDMFPENATFQKGYNFGFVVMENNYTKLSKSKLPEKVKESFSQYENVYVFPIFVKYKHSGYIIASLNNESVVNTIKVATSILSREFTLLPLKNRLKQKTTHSSSKSGDYSITMSKIENSNNTGDHETIEVKNDGDIVITKSTSSSYTGDDEEITRAKKYAKLLVDELELYNKKDVEKGRMKGGLKTLLKADIERSFESFRHRFSNSDKVPDEVFESALVMYLAKGNSDLL